jgi:hypothetical protein
VDWQWFFNNLLELFQEQERLTVVGTGYRPPELIQLGIERRTPPPLPLPAPLSTDEKLKALVAAFATMAGYGLTFVAILLLLLGAWVACRQYSVLSSWGRADAEVISGEVYSDFIRNDTGAQTQSRPVYGFRSTVRFQANGHLYESQADIGYKKSAKSEMIDWYLRFPSGSHTVIAYDPVSPNRVKLAENFETAYAGALTTLEYAGWLLLCGCPLVLVSRKLRRQRQRALDQDFPIQPDFG